MWNTPTFTSFQSARHSFYASHSLPLDAICPNTILSNTQPLGAVSQTPMLVVNRKGTRHELALKQKEEEAKPEVDEEADIDSEYLFGPRYDHSS
jgi:hypothetical protein